MQNSNCYKYVAILLKYMHTQFTFRCIYEKIVHIILDLLGFLVVLARFSRAGGLLLKVQEDK